MSDAIRKNAATFTAIVVLVIVGLATLWVILQNQRMRVPVLEERPFELKAQFETAQAVVAGQGQTLRVAGVKVGDVADVELDDGRAVVSFAVERDNLPIYRDATVLLRPTTALKDMFFQLDPGTKAAGEIGEGGMIPVANTAPDVNLDEILEALDSDTQAYLRLLLVGAGEGLDGNAKRLGRLLGSLGPINRKLARLNGEVARRDEVMARLVHNLNEVTGAAATADEDLARLVEAADEAVGAIAENDPDLRGAVRELPSVVGEARAAFEELGSLADRLGPAAESLRPFARRLPEMSASLERLATGTTGPIRDRLRPFARAARPQVPKLGRAATRFDRAGEDLPAIAAKVNKLLNMAAYNPRGAEDPGAAGRDEGYLFWAAWLTHNGTSVFETEDAHGLSRRFYDTVSCAHAATILTTTPLEPFVRDFDPLFAEGGPCA